MNVLTKNKLTEHDVFEFMKGTFSGTHWLEDSLYIPEDLFQQMELEKIFNTCLNHFSYFGVTTVIPSECVLKQKNASLSAEYNTVALS